MSLEELMRWARPPPRGRGEPPRAQGTDLPTRLMSAFIDYSTGAGLASSTGVRPYLPALLAGGLARSDVGIDFDGTDFHFLESTWFLAALVAVAIVAFLLERSRTPAEGRGLVEFLSGVMGLLL